MPRAHLFQVLAHSLQELGAVGILLGLLGPVQVVVPLQTGSLERRAPLAQGAALAQQELLGTPQGLPFSGDVALDTAGNKQGCPGSPCCCTPHTASPKPGAQCPVCKAKLGPWLGKAEQKVFLAQGCSPIKLELTLLGTLTGWGRLSGRVLRG